MPNNVHQIDLSASQMPQEPNEKAAAGRHIAQFVTKSSTGYVHYLQGSTGRDDARLTISVPQAHEQINERLAEAGHLPIGTEESVLTATENTASRNR